MSNITIHAPNKEWSGTRNGVPFLHGKAEVPLDYAGLDWFLNKHYIVELPESGIYNEEETEVPFEEDETTRPLEEHTIAELKAIAEEKEIDLTGKKLKADIISALLE